MAAAGSSIHSRRILCVGLTCVDIISVVPSYPKEDSDNRCLRQTWSRGGNASNNATVLAILGNDQVACLSCLSRDDFLLKFVLDDFTSFDVDTSFLALYRDGYRNGVSSIPKRGSRFSNNTQITKFMK